jgi:phosphonopyruvate decarboxylase
MEETLVMIDPADFFDTLSAKGVGFVAGVPDSLLKEACRYLDEVLPRERHVIAVNEGSAIALASGHHLATGTVPLVYMQNSGLGNAINPLLSLADPEVYALPMVLLIGWRGEPGVRDEPQHVKQGRVTAELLDVLEIPYRTLDGDADAGRGDAAWAVAEATARQRPVALLARKGVFAPSQLAPSDPSSSLPLTRERAIEAVVTALRPDTTVVATTGMIARELYEWRRREATSGDRDFLTVGSMGHASQIALGIATARPEASVACLDGDGAALMHLGGLATIGASGAGNYLHVVLNNGVHDSVGGQPTVGFSVDFPGVAQACGYLASVGPVTGDAEVMEAVRALQSGPGPALLEVRVATGARADLGRPKEAPVDNKRRFMGRFGIGVDPA